MIQKIIRTIANGIRAPRYSLKFLLSGHMSLRRRLQFIHNFDKIQRNGWKLVDVIDGLVIFENTKWGYKLLAKDTVAFTENLEKMYSFPRTVKVDTPGSVLDVGAFVGDTALYFLSLGFDKVLAYEPVPDNVGLIRKNIELNREWLEENKKNIEVFPYAVCEKEGETVIESTSEPGTASFGLKERGKIYRLRVNCVSWEDVLSQAIKNGVVLAKIDCEGCEKGLASVEKEIVSQIPLYIIETHSREIEKEVTRLLSTDYDLLEAIPIASEVKVLKFARNNFLEQE